jgi:hypothetical protein
MKKLIFTCACLSSVCFAVNLPWGSSGSIGPDMTVKNPEKFAQGKLIPQYLDKAKKYLDTLMKDKSLSEATLQAQKRNKANDLAAYNAVNAKLQVLTGISDRLNALMRRLQYVSGQEYYKKYEDEYFVNLRDRKDKASDPFNILKIAADKVGENRDCLYRFLAWNFPGQKTTAQIRAMGASDIMKGIDELKQNAFKAGLRENSSYVLLVREIGAFFNDELAKEEYDAFVDGPEALNRLTIPDARERKNLKDKASVLYVDLLTDSKMKMQDAARFLSSVLRAAA